MDPSLRGIRILFNTPRPGLRGGPPTHLPILEKALRKLVTVHTYEYGRKSDVEGWVEKCLGRTHDLFQLRMFCRRLQPDLIHHNSAFDHRAILRDAPLVLLAKRERIPVFIKVHGSMPEAFRGDSAIFNRARQIVLSNANCIGVLSAVEKAEFEEAFPFVRGKVRVVKNVISPDFSGVKRVEAARPTVLFLSRFIRRKGPFDLLRAVPLVLKKRPDVDFLFVGDGEDAARFDREVAASNLGSAVRRIPQMNHRECLSLYAKAWMMVFPTHFPEGMPMVVAEAMAAGVPIISTPTRFSKSYMTEGVHVIYNQLADAEGIGANVLRMCSDRELRERMSVANRQLALQFAGDYIAQEYVELYREVLSSDRNLATMNRASGSSVQHCD